MTRVVLLILLIVALLVVPCPILADEADEDLANRLTKPEAEYVATTRAYYAAVRAQLAPLRAALAAPGPVTVKEWGALGSAAANEAGNLSRTTPPPAFKDCTRKSTTPPAEC